MANKLASLDRQIQKLKQQKEKIETKLALSFLKETQRICGNEFSLGSVLTVLEHIWTLSSEIRECLHKDRYKLGFPWHNKGGLNDRMQTLSI